MSKKHTSYRGTVIDMDMLKYQNEHATALGNANMNARGDKIGRGGTVLKTREELLAERERELQLPDIMPEQHQSHSVAPAVEDFDMFERSFEPEAFEPAQHPAAQAEPVKAAPVKRAKTKPESEE